MGHKKECRECQEIKSESKFYATDKNICKECKKDYARIRYHEKKAIDLEKSPAVMHAKNLEDRITELENRLGTVSTPNGGGNQETQTKFRRTADCNMVTTFLKD